MYRSMSVLLALTISLNISGQMFPDYRAIYDFTNSDVSMEGVRELRHLKMVKDLCHTMQSFR